MVAALCVGMANAMPLNSSARAVIPADLQQLFSIDYRAIKDSPTAMQLKAQIGTQDNIKQFEEALKGVGINPDKDVDYAGVRRVPYGEAREQDHLASRQGRLP